MKKFKNFLFAAALVSSVFALSAGAAFAENTTGVTDPIDPGYYFVEYKAEPAANDAPEVDVNLPKRDVDVAGPKLDIDVPDVSIEGPEGKEDDSVPEKSYELPDDNLGSSLEKSYELPDDPSDSPAGGAFCGLPFQAPGTADRSETIAHLAAAGLILSILGVSSMVIYEFRRKLTE